MIPKKIHYCWFGQNPLPEEAIKCINSWKKFLPNYEIIEWNETNYDINKCNYVREAYQSKKWAFVSDYARFDILYNHGGLYFDTDVEIINTLDHIIKKGSFMGMEVCDNVMVAPGLGLGAVKNLELYKEILDYYEKINFINLDGSFNQTTIVKYTTDILLKYGFKLENKIQEIKEITIYPGDYFCPLNYTTNSMNITKNTVSIHHYSSSWFTDEEKKYRKLELYLKNKFGEKIGRYLIVFYMLPYKIKEKIKYKGFFGIIKFYLKKFLNFIKKEVL